MVKWLPWETGRSSSTQNYLLTGILGSTWISWKRKCLGLFLHVLQQRSEGKCHLKSEDVPVKGIVWSLAASPSVFLNARITSRPFGSDQVHCVLEVSSPLGYNKQQEESCF